jgi:hypothetical protein
MYTGENVLGDEDLYSVEKGIWPWKTGRDDRILDHSTCYKRLSRLGKCREEGGSASAAFLKSHIGLLLCHGM